MMLQVTDDPYAVAAASAARLIALAGRPDVAVVLGSGWAPAADAIGPVEAEVPLTDIAVEAFRSQIELAGPGPWLFPSQGNRTGHQTEFKKTWQTTIRRAGVPYFRLYDLRSTYATRLSAGGVADEWVTQMLRQTDAQVFKKYSQMKLQMKREALAKLNRRASELTSPNSADTEKCA